MNDEEKKRIREDEEIRCEVRSAKASTLQSPVPGLPDYEVVLKTIREEIHAEHTLISHRITWFVTSQAFLMAALAVSLNPSHTGYPLLRHVITWLGVVLSVLAGAGIWSAISAQWHVIDLQSRLLKALHPNKHLKPAQIGDNAFDDYSRVTCCGRLTGFGTHWIAMTPPFVIPILFAALWSGAYRWTMHLPQPNSTPYEWHASTLLLIIVGTFAAAAAFYAFSLWLEVQRTKVAK